MWQNYFLYKLPKLVDCVRQIARFVFNVFINKFIIPIIYEFIRF